MFSKGKSPMTSKQKRAKKARLIDEFGSCWWWCRRCLPAKQLTLDHLKPKSRGGSNSLENLRLACSRCNHSRGDSLYPPQVPSHPSKS
ncbi:HNH endonuclease [Leptolyngbya sp. CCY15150]|uniref:HNH endonuclease n=1 Tax=Leptolyngbya sp. CCY15150 TaxID=2767772 RepID=UPI00195174A3